MTLRSCGFAIFDILLHGGSQAGDPAILLTVSLQSYISKILFPSMMPTQYLVMKRLNRRHSHDTTVGIDENRVDGVRRTWPSRVPFKINCSAMLAVTRRCRGSRCVKGKKERNQRLFCKT